MNNKLVYFKSVKLMNKDDDKCICKKKNNNIENIYNYLNSRAFDYYPKLIDRDDKYDYFEFVNDSMEPYEQKVHDMMSLLSLLHSKTTFYKEIDIEDYKYIYEYTLSIIDDNYKYFNMIIDNIENEVYMSPSSYLLARNISKVFASLNYCKININKWYELVKEKRKVRLVLIHNNLELDHYLKSDKPYFLSWDKSRIDMPINDLYIFYKKHFLDFDFYDLFSFYESKYPLMEEERLLLFIYLALPDKINLNDSEFNMCNNVRRFLDYLYKTESLIAEYEVKTASDKDHK